MTNNSAGPDSASDFFYRDLGGGRYESTAATAGPWSPKAQHAGPPSALLGRALERHEPRDGFRIARVTLELPRPVPVGEVEVAVRTVRSGGRAELLEGELSADGRPVMYARAWRIAAAPGDTPALRPLPPPPALPEPQPLHTMAGAHLDGYVSAMEWRFGPGGGFDVLGPGSAWVRQRVPLVAGEDDTPLTRALTVADSTWAVAFELDHHRRLVINTDVTLALHREPVGEWFCLRAATAASPDGSGLASGTLDDAAGDCGRVVQTLLVAER
ncbi:thioesterase family protein [Streptomyces sp. PTM05]|uniref:Thioesterase family protein n=1 Tax=Streptantibioticus parmotrematis TaxID=2873249 RepID=A0ABS7R4R5_9ACTN|nr:thioesterase family protein [Streptantibioticus parmotrematis]MBY8889034.1 thioesterase family protein [Streptantibioticus parmotrematis]